MQPWQLNQDLQPDKREMLLSSVTLPENMSRLLCRSSMLPLRRQPVLANPVLEQVSIKGHSGYDVNYEHNADLSVMRGCFLERHGLVCNGRLLCSHRQR